MTCPDLTTATANLSDGFVVSLATQLFAMHNSSPDVAVDMVALGTELPLQRAHCCSLPGAVLQNFIQSNFWFKKFRLITKTKLNLHQNFNTKINQTTVYGMLVHSPACFAHTRGVPQARC